MIFRPYAELFVQHVNASARQRLNIEYGPSVSPATSESVFEERRLMEAMAEEIFSDLMELAYLKRAGRIVILEEPK